MNSSNEIFTECDKEPIHLLSKIKPHGFVIVVDIKSLNIVQLSDNTHKFIQEDLGDILNQSLNNFFNPSFIMEINQTIKTKKSHSFRTLINDTSFFCTVHYRDNHLIVEFEQLIEKYNYEIEEIIEKILKNCSFKLDYIELLTNITKIIQDISGFDRVMIYKFDEHYNGEVVAQSIKTMHEDFLGHHFPASDIPAQARQLYVKNRFRVIENVNDEPANIIPTINPINKTILDMSFCHLRSVSSMHIEYLKNMNVTSSMSISIIIEDKLWGLVACHDTKPNFIPMEYYKHYDLISKLLSIQIEQKERLDLYEEKLQMKFKRELYIQTLSNNLHKDFLENIEIGMQNLSKVIDCDDCILIYEDKIISSDHLLVKTQLAALHQIIQDHIQENIFVSNTLGNDFALLNKFSKKLGGVLCAKLPTTSNCYLIFVRLEQIYTKKWAGDIHKKIEYKNSKPIIAPRSSFESWKEIVKGTSKRFSQEEIHTIEQLAKSISFLHDQSLANKKSQKLIELNEKLKIQANTDPLTLLYNQRYFKDFGSIYFEENKAKENFSLALIDIDNFKSIKELYGNEICDLILISLTNIVKKHLPKNSLFSRVGCEEFAILFLESDFKTTLKICTKLRQEIHKSYIVIASDTKVAPLISIGLAQKNKDIKNFSDMIRIAEVKLSIAQDSGGDIISF